MDFFTCMETRREITQFKSTPISPSFLQQILETACLSVTGNNLPSREFVLVRSRDDLDQLSQATPFMPWLKQTPAAIVVLGNPVESKYWLQDATIAASNIWLAATSLDIGAAWGAIHHSEDPDECTRRETVVRDVLDIPENFRPVVIMGLGYPAEPPKRKEAIPFEDVVHANKYGQRVTALKSLVTPNS